MFDSAFRSLRKMLAYSTVLTRDFIIRRYGERAAVQRPLMLWPAFNNAIEWNTMSARLNWLAPPLPEPIEVFAPQTHPFSLAQTDLKSFGLGDMGRSRIRLVPCSSKEQAQEVWSRRPIILLWKTFSRSAVSALPRLSDVHIIDPTFFSSFEEVEWMRLYLQAADDAASQQRVDASAAFESFLNTVSDANRVNVCGNGPSLSELTPSWSADAINMVCNSAIESKPLMDQLRPSAVGFIDSVLFGPSLFARRYFDSLQRCVDTYDSYVFVPAGYAQFLLSQHYPFLRGRLIGMELVPELSYPTITSLRAAMSGSVVTCLLLPAALGIRPKHIAIWGCDGRDSSKRGVWSYRTGLSPRLHEAAAAHPAHFRDNVPSEKSLSTFYETYCDHFERLLSYIEQQGVLVESRSFSHVPALAARYTDCRNSHVSSRP